jgi:glycerophosphoryl diester phosphodiesterase
MRPFRPTPEPGAAPYLVAHRGISAKAPENTLAAINRALNAPGIDMIELDVRLSRDEEVIVLHDRTLQRTTTGNGPARSYSLAELKDFDAGSWYHPQFTSERIPTLREVIERVRGQCWLDIEIKSDVFHREPEGLIEQRVLDVVCEAKYEDFVMYSSFDHQLLARLKRLRPGISTSVLYSVYRDFGRLPSKLVGRVNASGFVCAKHELTRAMVRDAHHHNIPLYIYTLNSISQVERIMQLGVQGIISDTADDLVSVVKRKSS